MVTIRSYEDTCAAHALDLIGERWALLVVRELLLGPKRFTDLRAGLPNVSSNVLAQRLRELEQAGVVRRRKDRKSTRLNSSHANISYAVFCLKKKMRSRRTRTGSQWSD